MDLQGNIYFCSLTYVRKVATNGIITTVAGNGAPVFVPLLDNGKQATAVGMDPIWVAVDSAGNLSIVDGGDSDVFKVDSNGVINLFAGSAARLRRRLRTGNQSQSLLHRRPPVWTISGMCSSGSGNVAPVSFSGLAPGFVGLYQVNVEVPPLVASGNARVNRIIAGGGNSNTVLLPIQ